MQQHALAALTNPSDARHLTRLLIVDHETDSCASMKLMLLDLGYRSTCTAQFATQALSLTGRFSPHIVLLDLDLPDMSVYQLADLMRTHARMHFRRLTLLAVAARETHASGDLARAAGFHGYLTKPIESPQLDSMIRQMRG